MGQPVAPGAAVPTEIYSRTLTVDPVNGDDANDGMTKPWKTIQTAKLASGDKVQCASGNYGDFGPERLAFNSFVLICAAPGAVPVFSFINIQSCTYMILRGLTVRRLASGYLGLISITRDWQDTDIPSSNIIIDGCDIASTDDASAWTQADWQAKASVYGIFLRGGNAQTSDEGNCITICNNRIRNVGAAIAGAINNVLYYNNQIDYLCGDGIDFAGSNLRMIKNRITNSVEAGDGTHKDGMQGQPGYAPPGYHFQNIFIDNNVVIAKADPNLKFPGDMQGISAFDQYWDDVTVTNNVVITSTYHGMTWVNSHRLLIANNTVIGTNPAAMTWIGVRNAGSDDIVVRNNICTGILNDFYDPSVTFDHDMVGGQIAWHTAAGPEWISDPGVYGDHNTIVTQADLVANFVKFDPVNCVYDVHLVLGSPAIGAGALPAPPYPDGTPRVAPVNLGAL